MASMTNYLEDALIGHVFLGIPYTAPTDLYLAVYTTATTDAGGGTEVTGGSYARQLVVFEAGGTGIVLSDAEVQILDMPGVNVTHAAICDALTAGNMLLHNALSAPKTVTAGAPLVFPAGDIAATFA